MNFFADDCSIKEIDYSEPIHSFKKYSALYYSSLLTGNGSHDISSYSYIGINPHTIIRYKKGEFEIENEHGIKNENTEFWNFLKVIYDSINFDKLSYPANICGFIGYLSYDIYHTIEKIDSRTEENYQMPLFEIVLYNNYIFFDHHKNKSYYIEIQYKSSSFIKNNIKKYENYIDVKNLLAECGELEYANKVKKIKNYILEGDVYEVCLSQQFSGDFEGNPYSLFKKIYEKNPAPFSAYLNCKDIKILCNSPELFLRCKGKKIETRPIKGTAPRGSSKEEDRKNREALLLSEKDQAELYMIIDLLRNDIGKVCKTGSVRVVDKKRLEAYENVYQLIGIVEGELEEKSNYIDLLKATFPGGSITGCPKIRSMEIIEELETYKRNIYTGTIFLFNRQYFVSNIVIRTAVICNGKIYINSGGAVTIDSVPENEYREILHKVKNLMKVMGQDSLV